MLGDAGRGRVGPDGAGQHFADASRVVSLALPGRSLVGSTSAGWTSLLLEARVRDGRAALDETESESRPTPDQTLAVSLSGEVELASLRQGVWRRAVRQAGAPDLYAATVAQYLATHLLSRHSAWGPGADDHRRPGPLTDRRLARVVEYMRAHLAEPLTLERLGAEAAISKFHFVRLFRAATGETPHAYVVRLRMRAAREMLRDTTLTAAEVAAAIGYASAAHFTRAFARRHGRTPTAFRAEGHRRG